MEGEQPADTEQDSRDHRELNEIEHKLCKQIVLMTDAVWSLEYC